MERAISTTPAVEEWRPVVGFEGLYEVSNIGRVRSLPYTFTRCSPNGNVYTVKYPARIRKLQIVKGYYYLLLKKNGKYYPVNVHRLVAKAFIPNPDNLPEVNHIDENRLNSAVWNLEWCDHYHNMRCGTVLQRVSASKPKRQVEQLTLDGKHVAYYESRCAAARAFNRPKANILSALSGRSKTAYGYIWKYVDGHIKHRSFTDVEQLTLDGQLVATYPSAGAAANALGTKYVCIYKALTGLTKIAKGYRWRSKCSFI